MSSLPIVLTVVGLVIAALLVWRMEANSRARKKLRGFETRKEVEDEVENLSDSERHAAGNKWVR